ncbi:transposable element Tcb1 transposase [Trichonephila clavipes]|nr:transposable element Tcb1 transposase [Trichonephila clavipes]
MEEALNGLFDFSIASKANSFRRNYSSKSEMKVTWCEIRAVWWMVKAFPTKSCNMLDQTLSPRDTTDRRGRSHPPQCNTSREDRQIVRKAVTDRLVTSRTVAQHILFLMHHSVSAHTIRRRLQQSGLSARRPLLGLPLTQNHRRLHRQWCDERRMWVAEWNEVVFTDESRICLQHHDGWICTHCRYFKQLTLHLRGVGASCPSLPSGFGHSHISTG